jgi:hypothetical protein
MRGLSSVGPGEANALKRRAVPKRFTSMSFIKAEARQQMGAVRGPAPLFEREPVMRCWRSSVVLGED